MKKKIVLGMIILSAVFLAFPVLGDESNDGSILFRNIAWLSREEDVKNEVKSIEGIRPSWFMAEDEMARIDSWKHDYNMMYSDINVEEAGVILNYENVNVAGYNSELELSFIFPIVDGKILYDIKESQFYKAEYTLEEMVDVEGAYNDLCTKLSSLYGKGTDTSSYDSFDEMYSPKRVEWYGSDGSVVCACMFYNTFKEKYDECRVTYAAPGTDDMLVALANQKSLEGANAEAITREENSGNMEGL